MKRILLLFTIPFILFTNCTKDNTTNDLDNTNNVNKPSWYDDASNETIVIDENSAFNMRNFLFSFEQILRWKEIHELNDGSWYRMTPYWLSFSHNLDTDGFSNISTANNTMFGNFGNNAFSINYTYNEQGVIESAIHTGGDSDGNILYFEYDTKGLITKLTSSLDESNSYLYEYNIQYDDLDRITNATLVDDGYLDEDFIFTYNDNGQLFSTEDIVRGLSYKNEFIYTSGKLSEQSNIVNGRLNYTKFYKYDSDSRLIETYEDVVDKGVKKDFIVEYNSDSFIIKIFNPYGDIKTVSTQSSLYKIIEITDYIYSVGGEFRYAKKEEKDVDGEITKSYYYENTPDNLNLIGYSIVDSRESGTARLLTASYYNADDTKLCSVDNSGFEKIWNDENGSYIDSYKLPDWVTIILPY